MPEITIVDSETGRILRSCGVIESDVPAQSRAPNEIILEGTFDARTRRYDGSAIVERPLLFSSDYHIAADGLDTLTLAIPAGTTLEWDGQAQIIEDGSFEFSTVDPGESRFTFWLPFPYQRQTIRVIAQ